MSFFDKFKKKTLNFNDNSLKDNYKTREYYINKLKKTDEFITKIKDKDGVEKNENYYIILNSYIFRKIKFLYVLGEDFSIIKDFVKEYCNNLSNKQNLTYNEICDALSMAILFGLEYDQLQFIKSKMVDEKYIDATLELLANMVFNNKILNTKDFYYKDKGYFGDEFVKDNNGLMKVIYAVNNDIKNQEFKNYLDDIKEKHYNSLLNHYEKIGEERYIYTGSFDFKLTALAKILDIDKEILNNSKFIANDLI